MDMTESPRSSSGGAHRRSLVEASHRGLPVPRRRELLSSRPLAAVPSWHPDVFFLLSESGTFLDYHASDRSQLPIAPKAFLSRHLSEVLAPKPARMFLDAMAQARRSRAPIELEHALQFGTEERHYEIRFIAVPHAKVVCVVRDVTSRVRTTAMSQEIERLRSDLAHASRVSMIGRLAPSLVHELNQPLAAVLANANAAQRLLSANTELARDQLPEILVDIAGGIARARQLIERLQNFARKGSSDPESLDMSSVVEDVALVARTELVFRRVSFELQLARKPVPV